MDGCHHQRPDKATTTATTAAHLQSGAGRGAAAAATDIAGATTAAAAKEQKDAELQAHCAAIKAQLHGLLDKFCNGLSHADFEPMLAQVLSTEQRISDTDKFIGDFRQKLLDKLLDTNETFWQQEYVDDNLMFLHELSNAAASEAGQQSGGRAAVAWRQTGQTPHEQVRFYRMFLVRAKCAYLQKQLSMQPTKMRALIEQVEERRQRMEEMQARREALRKQMDLRGAELLTANAALRAIHAELLEE